jgi:hypothetical protein
MLGHRVHTALARRALAAGYRTFCDVPQPRVGEICRKVSFWRTIVLRPLAALRPTTASEMKAIPL